MPELLQGGTELLRSAHVMLRLYRSRRIALLTRSEQAFETASAIDRCVSDLARGLPHAARRELRIIIDTRRSPLRVHPALDPAFERFRKETQAGFLAAAIVIASPVGRARAERFAAPVALPIAIFGSLAEALDLFDTRSAKVAC
jgi:hypothetical protein